MNDINEPVATTVDSITIELIRGAMRSIQNEMEALIERTAMSAFIREKKDFYAGLIDGHGRFIAGRSGSSIGRRGGSAWQTTAAVRGVRGAAPRRRAGRRPRRGAAGGLGS